MIPQLITFQFQEIRQNNEESGLMSIATRATVALEDIKLIEVMPTDIDDFLLFVCSIANTQEGNDVAVCLKTKHNLTSDDVIARGCYFSTYLLPSYRSIMGVSMSIHDMFSLDKKISVSVPNIFNELFISKIILPTGTFTF